MSEDHREYLRDLAMHVLADARAAELTAAEVAERMGIVAMGDGHPKRSWSSIDGWTVSGVLRRLEGDGLAVRGEPSRSARKGREEPTYRIAAHAAAESWPVPMAPLRAAAAPAPAGQVVYAAPRSGMTLGAAVDPAPAEDQPGAAECSRWAHLSRSELEALLDYADAAGDVTRAAALITAIRSAG